MQDKNDKNAFRSNKYMRDNEKNKSFRDKNRYERHPPPNDYKPRAKLAAGNDTTLNNTMKNDIIFLADSGATEHIVNKSIILSNFVKSSGKSIRSANKNRFANIIIDGRGNLTLFSQSDKNKCIKLRVIKADEISENLISLSKFADLGLSIYLDNKTIKIYDAESD